jgi:hypothetical protein
MKKENDEFHYKFILKVIEKYFSDFGNEKKLKDE